MNTTLTDHPGSQVTLQDELDGETLMRMVGGQSALPQKGGKRTCIVRNCGQIAKELKISRYESSNLISHYFVLWYFNSI